MHACWYDIPIFSFVSGIFFSTNQNGKINTTLDDFRWGESKVCKCCRNVESRFESFHFTLVSVMYLRCTVFLVRIVSFRVICCNLQIRRTKISLETKKSFNFNTRKYQWKSLEIETSNISPVLRLQEPMNKFQYLTSKLQIETG